MLKKSPKRKKKTVKGVEKRREGKKEKNEIKVVFCRMIVYGSSHASVYSLIGILSRRAREVL